MTHWKDIDKALDSELENFERFMTGRDIEGRETENTSEKQVRKLEEILEKPLPERFLQQKLLEHHSL